MVSRGVAAETSVGGGGQVIRNLFIVMALVLVSAFLFSDHLASPFNRSHQGWNGGHYGMAARNFLRYGYWQLGFLPCVEPGAVASQPELYLRHPPLASLLASISVSVLGESEAALRLPSYLLSVATVPLLFLWLLRVFRGRSLLAAAAAITAMATPLWGYYAHHLEPLGPGVQFSLVGSLLFAHRWFEQRRLRDLMGCLLFMLFGFLMDWPAFYIPGFVGMLCLVGKGRPGARWCLSYWIWALLCGVGILLWIRHVGVSSGFGLEQLRATALHRVGWLGDFVDDAGHTVGLGAFVRWLWEMHQRMFLVPVSILGGAAAVVLVFRFVRGRDSSREALWLVPLGVGILHILVFPQGAFQHEFWQFFLSVGLAITPFALAFAWTRHGARPGLDRAAVVLSLVALALGAARVQARWADDDTAIMSERNAGEMLREHLKPEEVFLSNGAASLTPATVFYADRKNALAADPAMLNLRVSELDSRVGGILLRDEDVETFRPEIEKLGWEGPYRTSGYSFWDARP